MSQILVNKIDYSGSLHNLLYYLSPLLIIGMFSTQLSEAKKNRRHICTNANRWVNSSHLRVITLPSFTTIFLLSFLFSSQYMVRQFKIQLNSLKVLSTMQTHMFNTSRFSYCVLEVFIPFSCMLCFSWLTHPFQHHHQQPHNHKPRLLPSDG